MLEELDAEEELLDSEVEDQVLDGEGEILVAIDAVLVEVEDQVLDGEILVATDDVLVESSTGIGKETI